MKVRFLCSLSAIALLAVLVGCTAGVQGSRVDGTGNSMVSDVTATPSLCPPEQSFARSANGESDMAPPYEQIRWTVQCIVKANRPVTQQQSKDLYEYQQSLAGKKVVGWQGWVLGVTPAKVDIEAVRKSRDPDFDPVPTAWITVDDPTGKPLSERLFHQILLFGLSQEQAEQLRAWTDPLGPEIPWQIIEFDGEIVSVDSYDSVNVLVSGMRADIGP